MAKQTYLQRDLIDYVSGGRVTSSDRHNRVGWVLHNLPHSAFIQYWSQGGYDGKLAFVIRLDNYMWLFNDYYGSCSGCDAFLRDPMSYTKDMFRSAYCFANDVDALEYVASTDDYSWNGVKGAVRRMIANPNLYLQNPQTRFIVRRRSGNDEKYADKLDGLEIIHREAEDES